MQVIRPHTPDSSARICAWRLDSLLGPIAGLRDPVASGYIPHFDAWVRDRKREDSGDLGWIYVLQIEYGI